MSTRIQNETSAQPYPSDASLYIGNLATDLTIAELVEVFSQAAPVKTARICLDRTTQKSRGYGYVSYGSAADADLALREFNHWNIKGKTCRVMKSLSGTSKELPPAANLFINHLPKDLSAVAFHDTFEKFGKILSSKLANDHLGASKGYGFVQYERVEDAQEAIKHVHLATLDFGATAPNRALQVVPFIKREERKSVSTFTNVFFRNLPLDMTLESFKDYARKSGEVTSVILNRVRKPKATTRTGCANYKDPKVAAKVVAASKSAHPREIIAVPSIKKSSLSAKSHKSASKILLKSSLSRRNLKAKPVSDH